MARTLRRTKLPQCLGFDLPDALARDIKLLPDLFQSVLPLAADAEPQPVCCWHGLEQWISWTPTSSFAPSGPDRRW